jgi:ribosomal subunit interface protein
MNITIKKTLDVTPPLETYIEEKLMPLAKFVKAFDRDGVVELKLEVSRTSKHHRKGEEVFMACADLRLPGKILRSEASATDIRKAIDEVRDMLHMEIERYKTKREDPPRGDNKK